MGNENKGLEVRELLENTYSLLFERHNPREIALPDAALVEVGNDSDPHRTRIGYMRYENIGLFQLDRKSWAIARRERWGDYPSERYDSDILALEFLADGKTSEQIQKELTEEIGRGSYFENSLIYGMADGNLSVNDNGKLGKKMLEKVRPEIGK